MHQTHAATTAKSFFTDTCLVSTSHYYGQFALSLGKESPYMSSKLNPLNTDTPLIQTLSMAPSASMLVGFDCSTVVTKMLKGLCHGSPVHFVLFCQILLALTRYGT